MALHEKRVGAPGMRSRIDQLAEHLLREGHVDNEADARLAAIHLLAAASGMTADEPPTDHADEDADQ